LFLSKKKGATVNTRPSSSTTLVSSLAAISESEDGNWGRSPLRAISIAFLLDNGLRPTFCPAVQTCAREYTLPYLWNTRRLFGEGSLA
jgi:hypothetical protein